MIIKRISPLTGKENQMDISCTEKQMREFESPNRRKIQDIFPNLSQIEREFILTGYTSEDWDKIFPEE